MVAVPNKKDMGYTITEKVLLAHTKCKSIKPGEFINAKVDLALGNDITAPIAIEEFKKLNKGRVFDRNKIVFVPDHFAPNKDRASANQCKLLAEFAAEFKIEHYYEVGRMGIEHALLPELGLVGPGQLVIGADSHTCTYGALGAFSTGVGSTDLAAAMATGTCWFKVPESMKLVFSGRLKRWVGGKDLILFIIGQIGVDGALYKAMEFAGPLIRRLPMDDRFAMCNMVIEAGAKNGIIEPDEVTREYLRSVHRRQCPAVHSFEKKSTVSSSPQSTVLKRSPQCPAVHSPQRKRFCYGLWTNLRSDEDASYCDVREFDMSKLEPQVALPHLPSNAKPVDKVRNVKLHQVVIGSCTNGRISDLRIAAKILRGRKVKGRLRLIVIPATQSIYLKAIKEGLADVFVRAGGVFSTPTCGPCIGGHMGVLGEGEVALATTNRNFKGRMGHPDSLVYLANPAVAAASAVAGKIVHPEEVI